MSPGTPSWRKADRSAALPAFLLAASLLLMGLLTLQAYRAERARLAGARQALLGYAQVVSFQHAAEAYQLLNREVPAAFAALDRAPEDQAGVEALLGYEPEAARCSTLAGKRWSFRFAVPDPESEWAAPATPTDVEWGGTPPDATQRALILEGARARMDGLTRDGGSYGVLIDGEAPDPVVVALAIRWRPAPENTSVYGLRTCLDRSGTSLFREAMLGRPALPPAITRRSPPDSIHAARIELEDGGVVWSSPLPLPATAEDTASITLWPPFDVLTLRTALRPGMRPLLAPGGGGGRLGVTFTLFALNGLLLLAALVQMRRERQLVRLREGFVSAVSHELRTPLQQMLLYGDLLQLGGLRSESDRERAAEVVARETRRLIHLVENVLRFRPGGDPVHPTRSEHPYALDQLVAQVTEEFSPLADTRRATLRSELASGADTDWHPDAVRRVLLNLLDNAVKYGPVGGTVTVRTETGDGTNVIEVEDQGPGVPARERERVFDPYVRGTGHVGGDSGGTGIGLAIVRELVVAAGGSVRIQEAVSGGARVLVRVPSRVAGRRSAE